MSAIASWPSPFAGNAVLVSRPSRPPRTSVSLRVTGAVPSANTLAIATLSWTGRHLRLVPTHSGFLELVSEDQASVRAFERRVLAFLDERQIELLFLRRGPSHGPMAVAAGTVRMEAVLQASRITCLSPHTQRVLAWLNSNEWLLPLPQAGLLARRRQLQARAIETAAFGMARILEVIRRGGVATTTGEQLGAERTMRRLP